MIFLSERLVKQNFRAYGFQNIDTGITDLINKAFFNFGLKHMKKLVQSGAGCGYNKDQQGGAVRLPSEYFGIASNHYVESGPAGVDMTVKDTWIRPPMPLIRMEGGEQHLFKVSQSSIQNMCQELKVKIGNDFKLNKQHYQVIKNNFEIKMHQAMKSLKRFVKNDNVKVQDVRNVFAMKKYSAFL